LAPPQRQLNTRGIVIEIVVSAAAAAAALVFAFCFFPSPVLLSTASPRLGRFFPLSCITHAIGIIIIIVPKLPVIAAAASDILPAMMIASCRQSAPTARRY